MNARFQVPPGERLFIIGGTYEEAAHWRREQGLRGDQVRIVVDARSLMGHRNVRVAMVGTWHDRRDVHDIVCALGAVGFNRVA